MLSSQPTTPTHPSLQQQQQQQHRQRTQQQRFSSAEAFQPYRDDPVCSGRCLLYYCGCYYSDLADSGIYIDRLSHLSRNETKFSIFSFSRDRRYRQSYKRKHGVD
jgi:hypothetical protein